MAYESSDKDEPDKEDIKSLCKALKAIWDRRIEKGEIEFLEDENGQRVILIK